MKKTRQAVALEYGLRSTPVVSAKGNDELAELIIAEAQRQGIHIAHDPRLAGLLGELKLGEDIPKNLFLAVAVILYWVYWLKGMAPGDEKRPGQPDQASV